MLATVQVPPNRVFERHKVTAAAVTDRGLEISGDASVLQRFLPQPVAAQHLCGEWPAVHDPPHDQRCGHSLDTRGTQKVP